MTAMIRLHLTPEDLGRIRFACSPLWEAILSFAVLRDPGRYALHLPWVSEARRALRGVDLRLLDALINPALRYFPDFLTPPPTSPLPDFATELEALRYVPADAVRREVLYIIGPCAMSAHGQCPAAQSPVYQLFLDAPERALAHLVDTLALYWDRTLAGHWPRLRQVLEGDVLYHARRLAFSGPEALFSGLHSAVRYRDGIVELGTRSEKEVALDRRGLLLVPVVFAWPTVYAIVNPPWPPTIIYNPRGIAELWSANLPPAPEALRLLVGDGRAQVLASLTIPRTTTELAHQLGLSAGAVSQHLMRLRRAGAIEPRRSGHQVYYGLTMRGGKILDQFDLREEALPLPDPLIPG